MNAKDVIWSKLEHLPTDKQAEVIDFIERLVQKHDSSQKVVEGQDWLKWGAGLHQEIWKSIDICSGDG